MSSDDIVQIQQLVCREREARDRKWWDEMRQIYHPDALISLSWYVGKPEGFIQGSMHMATKSAANHRPPPTTVRANRGKAVATLSAAIETRVVLDGVETDLDSQARLVYKAVKSEDGWKLFGLDCIYQRDTLSPAIPGEQVVVNLKRLKAYRSSCRCLSYVLESTGFNINQDLPGDDRPEQVSALYDDAFAWMKST